MGLFSLFKKQAPAAVVQPSRTVPEPAKPHQTSIDGYCFIDVETPNRNNNRICSIAAIRTDSLGNETGRYYTLVNPECEFDYVNIGIHGIHPEHVRGAMLFPDLWNQRLHDWVSNSVVVAHNARFDINVIKKAMDSYGIDDIPFSYIDTMRMAKKVYPEAEKYTLPILCQAAGVSMGTHHDAKCDAEACMGLFFSMVKKAAPSPVIFGQEPQEPRKRGYIPRGPRISDATKAKNNLKDLLEYVISDGRVSTEEGIALLIFLNDHEDIIKDPLIDPIVTELTKCANDCYIDDEESAHLLKLFSRYVNPADAQPTPANIEIDGKSFVLTGDFSYGSKDEVAQYIEQHGGTVKSGVTKTLDYVVIGSLGSSKWGMGTYGSKVAKAMEWQDKGSAVQIIKEEDFFGTM